MSICLYYLLRLYYRHPGITHRALFICFHLHLPLACVSTSNLFPVDSHPLDNSESISLYPHFYRRLFALSISPVIATAAASPEGSKANPGPEPTCLVDQQGRVLQAFLSSPRRHPPRRRRRTTGWRRRRRRRPPVLLARGSPCASGRPAPQTPCTSPPRPPRAWQPL